ncbi:MAG TPA: amidohydrolase family protein, partial [Gemmatimonadaceae bacterium]|nr:amidohydrolase family protein [Gemmatimonadaceae bacterium]
MRAIRLLAGVVVCGFSMACASAPRAPGVVDRPYDLVIENGRIVDGSGNAWVYGDLAVRGDRIVRVSRERLPRERAARVIDAAGRVVTPGFIDLHAHLDPLLRQY